MSTLRDVYGHEALDFEVTTIRGTYDCDEITLLAPKTHSISCFNSNTITSAACTGRFPTDYTKYSVKTSKPIDFTIEKVIYNYPATIVIWKDGTKTVVKCSENDDYDPEKGLAMAISKKALGNQGNYYNMFTKWLPEEEEGPDIMAEFMNFLAALKRNAAEEEKDGED